MSKGFMSRYKAIRGRIEDPMSKDWVLHTPFGALRMLRLEFPEELDFLCIHCYDETGAYRFIAFSDDQLMNFPLEVRKKTGGKKSAGFQFSGQGEDVSSSEQIEAAQIGSLEVLENVPE
jgi:hypothetical protein